MRRTLWKAFALPIVMPALSLGYSSVGAQSADAQVLEESW